MKKRSFYNLFFIFFIILLSWQKIFSLPSSPEIIHGNIDIEKNLPFCMQLSATDGTILHWQDFSILEKEKFHFSLPTNSSCVLNRVVGEKISSLLGYLSSNGHIFLINPNGILIGENAYIDCSSFTAATLDILNEEFLKKGELLFHGEKDSSIINLGKIEVKEGNITLFAHTIENDGIIQAKKGGVFLAAGKEILLKKEGDNRIFIRPRKFSSSTKTKVGIKNKKNISALVAEIKADGNLYSYAIQHEGNIFSYGIEEKEGGKIFLVAENGINSISGNILAKKEEEKGGEIYLLGEKVGLFEKANIDASGEKEGGKVFIGGDFLGKTSSLISNASNTYVDEKIFIDISAKNKGDGGQAIIWSDDFTQFLGKIDARGGKLGGNGGFVEISGKKHLDFRGEINLLAAMGNPGQLLLDPDADIIINAAGPTTGAFGGVTPFIYQPGQASDTLKIGSVGDSGSLIHQLSLGNVKVSTSYSGAEGPLGGRITVSNNMSYNSSNDLELSAQEKVIVNATITNSGSGDITLRSLSDNIEFTEIAQAVGLSTLGNIYFYPYNTFSLTTLANDSTIQGAAFTLSGGATNISITSGTAIAPSSSAVTLYATNGDLSLSTTGNTSFTTRSSTSNTSNSIQVIATEDLKINENISTSCGNVTLSANDAPIIVRGYNASIYGNNITVTTNNSSNVDVYAQIRSTTNNLNISARRDLSLVGGPTLGSNSLLRSFQNSSITAANNIYIDKSASINAIRGNISLIAGQDIYLRNFSNTYPYIPSIATDFPFGGNVTIVVDNSYPSSPEWGTGSVQTDPRTSISSNIGKVAIYTSLRSLNSLNGDVEGYPPASPSSDPPESHLYDNSMYEQWGTYYPDGEISSYYRIFYKDGASPAKINRANSITAGATSEMFRDSTNYTGGYSSPMRVKIIYDGDNDIFYVPPIERIKTLEKKEKLVPHKKTFRSKEYNIPQEIYFPAEEK